MSEYTIYTITETSDGFIIEEQCGKNIFPQTHKTTAREVIARLMQIMNVGPVAPQTFPEEVCIGYVESAPGETGQCLTSNSGKEVLVSSETET